MKSSLFYTAFINLLICILFSASALCQKTNPLFFQYAGLTNTENTDRLPGGKKYFIAQPGKAIMEENGRLQKFQVERQLDDSVFVISIEEQRSLPPGFPAVQANNNWKLSPSLLNILSEKKDRFPEEILLTVSQLSGLENFENEHALSFRQTTAANTFRVKVKNARAFSELIANPFINYLSLYSAQPKEELQINNLDLGTNEINLLHSRFPLLNGDSLVISIKENKPDTTDIDLAGRYIPDPLASPILSPHATIMATMAAGAGNSWYLGRGVASGANITSSDFNNLLPDADANYQQYHINVQNHSYGVGVENFYGADAAAFDSSAVTNDKLLFVFSAGNSGTQTPATGRYAGINKVANLTGSFKMAKNIITVGAIDSFYNVADLSSRGPAYDGRIKPELVAYGQDGSSGAAALVSGTALVLEQAYRNNTGIPPPSSLVKAVLLNSADDVAAPGIDFTSGFGSLDANKAAEGMTTQKYFTGAVSAGGSQVFSLAVPANLQKLKLTLVWNDLPAAANAFVALKNDLDLRVTAVSSGQVFLPWVLNSFANIDSLHLLPVRKRDSLNTVEQVSIDNPAAGNYMISVNGFSVTGATQKFSIAYQFDTANHFSWHFPTASDNIFPAAQNLLRWENNFPNAAGNIDYRLNNGASWLPVSANANLSTGYLRWNAPDTNAIAQLRMSIGANTFLSDAFTISARPELRVGFNCADSVMLVWNKNKGISAYELFGLGNKYLLPMVQVTDTQFVFGKNAFPYTNFAVAGLLGNRIAVKSFTEDYRTQGVECYVSNITADLITGNSAYIQLGIGTTYMISKIVFEKETLNGFIPLSEINFISGLTYNTTDTHLHKGVNRYRAVIYLTDGRIIYSRTTELIYLENDDAIIFPNPVVNGNAININFRLLNNQTIMLTDITGRILFTGKASSLSFSVPAPFTGGLYVLRISDPETHINKSYKIIRL